MMILSYLPIPKSIMVKIHTSDGPDRRVDTVHLQFPLLLKIFFHIIYFLHVCSCSFMLILIDARL